MTEKTQLPAKLAALLVYSRPFLVFGGMICALAVMWGRNPVIYTVGVSFLVVSMVFDLVDGWFSARFRPNAPLAPLADRLMDKLVYSIIFPVIAAGMMWRLLVAHVDPTHGQLLHAIFVLVLCVTVLVRDSFASFMRGFAIRQGTEPEGSEYNRMRTIVAAPVSALLHSRRSGIVDLLPIFLPGKRFPADSFFRRDSFFCHQSGIHCRLLQKIRDPLPG
jgi:phosphatidylglycerophosphate synthase